MLLTDILFPPRCPICHDIIRQRGRFACPGCISLLKPVTEPKCKLCGKMISNSEDEYCTECAAGGRSFDRGMSAMQYDRIMQRSISMWKYKGKREYTDFYAYCIWFMHSENIKKYDISCMIPVPIHPKRLRARGYNQSELLACALSEYIHVPVITKGIVRQKKTVAMKDLSSRERRENIRGAFRIDDSLRFEGTCAIVDDIYTTGATVEELARLIKFHGAKNVVFLAICSGTVCQKSVLKSSFHTSSSMLQCPVSVCES